VAYSGGRRRRRLREFAAPFSSHASYSAQHFFREAGSGGDLAIGKREQPETAQVDTQSAHNWRAASKNTVVGLGNENLDGGFEIKRQ